MGAFYLPIFPAPETQGDRDLLQDHICDYNVGFSFSILCCIIKNKGRGSIVNAEKKKWLVLIIFFVIVIIISLATLFNALKPKVDYESLNKEIAQYIHGLDNIIDIENTETGTYKITLDNEIWYSAEEKDKASYCLAVNTTITAICQKYKALKDTQKAYIYYYDESGVLIAEPSEKLYSLESKILY